MTLRAVSTGRPDGPSSVPDLPTTKSSWGVHGQQTRTHDGVSGAGRRGRRCRGARRLSPLYVGDLGDVGWSILRQPNVWVACALLCVGSMTQSGRVAKAARWPRDRLYAGRAAAAALSL